MDELFGLKKAFDQSGRIIVYTDSKGNIRYVNKSFEAQYGYSAEEVIGKNPSILNTGYHDGPFYLDLWKTIKSGHTWEGIFRNKTKSGHLVWEKACISPVFNDAGAIDAFLAIKEDITRERGVFTQLEKDHLFLEELFANAPVGIVILEPIKDDNGCIQNMIIVKANPSAGRVMNRMGLVGLHIDAIVPENLNNLGHYELMQQKKLSFEAHVDSINKALRFRSFPFGAKHICVFFYDVTHYKKTIQALAESEEAISKHRNQLNAIINNSVAGIVVIKNDFEISLVNTFFAKMMGIQWPEEMIGKSFFTFGHPDYESVTRNMLKGVFSGELDEFNIEEKFVRPNLRTFWGDVHVSPMRTVDGKVVEAVAVITDISDRKAFEERLIDREAELEELNATKDKLFSIIAHDVKNPFNAILGFSNLLKNNVDRYSKDEIKEFAGRILEASENVFKLMDDLLLWAKSQLGQMKVRPRVFKVKNLVNEAFQSFTIHAADKGIALVDKVNEEDEVFADSEMLRFVVRNLVHNGIKFTNHGGLIECSYKENGKYTIFTVADTGIGIRPEKVKVLFNVGEFMSTSGTSKEKGTGLGLHLANELITKHGGKIEVDSEVGAGTKFHIYLPKENTLSV